MYGPEKMVSESKEKFLKKNLNTFSIQIEKG
jgi:hypothetical protein